MAFPKLAWRKIHDKDVYNKIRKIETEEEKQHIIQLWQAVENAVLEYFKASDGRHIVNLIPDFHEEISVSDDEDDNDDSSIDTFVEQYPSRDALCQKTLDAIRQQVPILYQPSFQVGDCFVRADAMVLQSNGQYRLIEIKAKTGVRKKVTDDGEDKKIGQIEDKFIHDLSFQKYVINTSLALNNLPLIDSVYMAYLDKEYVKQGELDYMKLIKLDETDIQTTINVIQRKKETQLLRNDVLLPSEQIIQLVEKMQKELVLDETAFNAIHSFPGNKYIEYFGKDKPVGTIYAIPKLHHSKAPIVQQLHEEDCCNLSDLSYEQRELFYSKDGMWSAGEFIELYCACVQDGTPHILPDAIKQIFSQLTYPICFYDYESVSTPIPFMDNTYPYQQVVVQYSLHKFYPDGSMKHYGGVLWWQATQATQILQFDHANAVASESDKVVYGSYKDLLQAMLDDIGGDIGSSFIVRYKPFENTRNKEIAGLFPDLADKFLKINDNTFDLMDIFSQRLYFDPAFKWSCSIKKVLPILVPDMSYDHLEVGNGAVAMRKLFDLISGKVDQPEELIQNLLIYCGQDSLAMVRIFEKLKNIL